MKRMVIICYLLSMALFAVAQDINLETGKGLYQRAENNSQFSWSAKTYTDAIPYLQAAMKEGAEAYFMYADHAERNGYNGLEDDIIRNYGFQKLDTCQRVA